jgi:hypothetical protein
MQGRLKKLSIFGRGKVGRRKLLFRCHLTNISSGQELRSWSRKIIATEEDKRQYVTGRI